MGESRRKRVVVVAGGAAGNGPKVVDTLGGRMHVRWDEHAAASKRLLDTLLTSAACQMSRT